MRIVFRLAGLLLVLMMFTASVRAATVVRMETSLGTIEIELYPDKAPKTVDNFLKYVDMGYYDGLTFHRVIDDWVIQTGGYDADFMSKDTLSPIRNEATNGLKNLRGTVAMARYADPHSADSQFFINLSDNENLNHRARTLNDYGYCVFGAVIEGMEVADAIGDVETAELDGYDDVPVKPVLVNKMTVISRD